MVQCKIFTGKGKKKQVIPPLRGFVFVCVHVCVCRCMRMYHNRCVCVCNYKFKTFSAAVVIQAQYNLLKPIYIEPDSIYSSFNFKCSARL